MTLRHFWRVHFRIRVSFQGWPFQHKKYYRREWHINQVVEIIGPGIHIPLAPICVVKADYWHREVCLGASQEANKKGEEGKEGRR